MTVLLNDEQESNEARGGVNDRMVVRQVKQSVTRQHDAFRRRTVCDTLAMYHTAKLHAVSWSDCTLWLGDGQGGGTRFDTKLKIALLNPVHPGRLSLFKPSPAPSSWADKGKLSVAMETYPRSQCR